jgi:hypothetical protein
MIARLLDSGRASAKDKGMKHLDWRSVCMRSVLVRGTASSPSAPRPSATGEPAVGRRDHQAADLDHSERSSGFGRPVPRPRCARWPTSASSSSRPTIAAQRDAVSSVAARSTRQSGDGTFVGESTVHVRDADGTGTAAAAQEVGARMDGSASRGGQSPSRPRH